MTRASSTAGNDTLLLLVVALFFRACDENTKQLLLKNEETTINLIIVFQCHEALRQHHSCHTNSTPSKVTFYSHQSLKKHTKPRVCVCVFFLHFTIGGGGWPAAST